MKKTLTLSLLMILFIPCWSSHAQYTPPGYEVETFKWDSTGGYWDSLGYGPDSPARCWVCYPADEICESDAIQWIMWFIDGTEREWWIKEPGIYAADGITFWVKSDSNVVIDREGFQALQPESMGIDSVVETRYALTTEPTPPPLDDPVWILAEDLNSHDDTLFDSPALEYGGVAFKRWNLVKVKESYPRCDYSDTARVYLRTYGTCDESHPFKVRIVYSSPAVLSTAPTRNELNVPVSTDISVTFDKDMDEATIIDTTFVVNAWSTGPHQGTITYNSSTKTATLDPAEDFAVGEIVTVALTTGIESSWGIPPENSYIWSFTTEVSDDIVGNFSSPINWGVGDYPTSVFCADLDGDTDLDLAVANKYSYNISILKNKGNGTFQTKVDYGTGIHPTHIFCADLDEDTDLDLAVSDAISNNVSILMNNGDGTFMVTVNYGAGVSPISVFCADLDGDTDLDLAVANANSNNVSILKNNGDGTFQSVVNYGAGGVPYSVFCADLDGDSHLDLAVANVWSDDVSILMNNGDGIFETAVNYGAGDGPRSVFCADLDGDTDLDLAVANYASNNASILKNNGDGTYQVAVNYSVDVYAASIFCADLDGDSDLDLAVANASSDNISILFNTHESIPETLWIFTVGPVDMIVTDPELDSISVSFNTIPGATYIAMDDADTVIIPNPYVGEYRIRIVAEPGAKFGNDYTLGVRIDGSAETPPQSAAVPAEGESDSYSYTTLPYLPGDTNCDNVTNIVDVIYELNYLFKYGPAPCLLELGDANCDGIVDLSDVIYLLNYLFKNGNPPCSGLIY